MSTTDQAVVCHSVHPTLEGPDVRMATEFYRDRLGFEIEFLWGEPPVHGAVRCGDVSIHFSEGTPEPRGFWLYLIVDAVDTLFERCRNLNVQLLDEPESQPWGMREFNMRDLNGYQLRFAQPDLRNLEPLPIQRTDVQARIETRLAALIQDLASHKNMTVGEMLEEVLLHSFEAMPDFEGQGVASPHTRETLAHIEILKRRHGLDYQTHDSYRFRE